MVKSTHIWSQCLKHRHMSACIYHSTTFIAYTLVISHSVCHLHVIICMNPHEILVQFEIHNQVLTACMWTVSISNLVQQINCVI
jgi:hypothetical protein